MTFEFQNLGSIKKASLEMGNLTVVCGKNNTGKTYLTYAVWGFMSKWKSYLHEMENKFTKIDFKKLEKEFLEKKEVSLDLNLFDIELKQILQDNITKLYIQDLKKIFNTNETFFKNTSLKISFAKINFSNSWLSNLGTISFRKQKNSNILHIKEIKSIKNVKKTKGTESLPPFKWNKDNNIISEAALAALFVVGVAFIFSAFLSSESMPDNPKHPKDGKGEDKTFLEMILYEWFEHQYFPTPFILSAERTSASLFQKELNRSRDELIKAKLFDNLKENVSSLSLPVQMNLDFERDIEQIQKENSYISEKHPELLAEVEKILGINYLVLEGKLLLQSGSDFIPFYLCSTSVRSLAQLHLWIKHKARLGDLLMIDEPELNLHPENQVKIARLLVKLVNIGIKVWITTHSDYIIKELNNCLMFSNDFQDKAELMQEFDYSKMDILNPNYLRAYIAADNTVYPVKIDKFGMNMTTFDEEIAKINHISNELSNAIR
jgi:predicted ATP-dependent endonuclease of OLD family